MVVIPVRNLSVALMLLAFALAGLAVLAPGLLADPSLTAYKLDQFLGMGQPNTLSAWYAVLIFLAGGLGWGIIAHRSPATPARRFYIVMAALSIFLTIDHSTNTLRNGLEAWSQSTGDFSARAPSTIFVIAMAAVFYTGRRITAAWRTILRAEFYGACALLLAGWLWRMSDPGLLIDAPLPAVWATLLRLIAGVLFLHCALVELAQGMPVALTFERSRRLVIFLVAVVLVFLVLSSIWRVLQLQPDGSHFDPYQLWRLFDVRDEKNFPTLYSVTLWLMSAGLLWLIGLAHRRDGPAKSRPWFGLAAIFLCLSLDESASLHEKLVVTVRRLMPMLAEDSHGLLKYGWIIPVGALVLCLLMAYLPFLKALPQSTRKGMIAGGFIFVAAALVFEVFEGYAVQNLPKHTDTVIETVEEVIEMLGLIVFIDTLLRYLALHVGAMTLRFSTSSTVTAPD